MAGETITAGNIIDAVDKLLGLLDKKKSKDERDAAERVVNNKIIEIATILLKMNIMNAQLPENSKEVARLRKAWELWNKFIEHFKKYNEHHTNGDDDKAKDELSQAKVYLKEFKEIIDEVNDEKKYLLRKQQEEANNDKNKKNQDKVKKNK